MEINDLRSLLVDELRDLYHAEKQLTKALPKMAKAASSEKLAAAFETHLEETKGHIERLERAFEQLEEPAKTKTCKAMKGLIEEGEEMMDDVEGDAVDAALISAAQKVEHYEIASYGTVRTFAQLLGENEVANLLQQTLDEESRTDKKLTELAESEINLEAIEQEA